jgi:hypothetical protein
VRSRHEAWANTGVPAWGKHLVPRELQLTQQTRGNRVGGAEGLQQHCRRGHAALRLYLLPCHGRGRGGIVKFWRSSTSPGHPPRRLLCLLCLLWCRISSSCLQSACSTAVLTAHSPGGPASPAASPDWKQQANGTAAPDPIF